MKFLSILALIAPLAFALPTSVVEAPVEDAAVEARQSCYSKCGSVCYTAAQVTAARNAGANHVRQGTQAGSSTYPHVFNNREGFNFLNNPTYYEFPIKTSGVYTGGSPGADRVVFNSAGTRSGEITHTGASGNNFVKCTGW
ncbi:Ribonuclease/ribotoxin [Boeremia exigua]|uniref:Ribonuclease/ribotoxin n=1 Tax=Boeremia exigua TaxID=749465 RepID=UPI001E8EA357|nr:Ribonuclease/ribotoxin [Boeremia exigua]KAH6642340.1 Ribonuclease/ribotoxin [Boeremia exigua]